MESPVETPAKRYRGWVKYWRGSFGWITSPDVAEMYPDMDVFLHKRDCDTLPKRLESVSFLLTVDEKGNPKAMDARVEALRDESSSSPKVAAITKFIPVSARDFF